MPAKAEQPVLSAQQSECTVSRTYIYVCDLASHDCIRELFSLYYFPQNQMSFEVIYTAKQHIAMIKLTFALIVAYEPNCK